VAVDIYGLAILAIPGEIRDVVVAVEVRTRRRIASSARSSIRLETYHSGTQAFYAALPDGKSAAALLRPPLIAKPTHRRDGNDCPAGELVQLWKRRGCEFLSIRSIGFTPLSAVVELRWTETMSRDAWQIRIETEMRLSCTRDGFLLQGSLRAWEGANEVCRRERDIPRDFL
jgi:hypothetical protein